jgi:hypothetical protein
MLAYKKKKRTCPASECTKGIYVCVGFVGTQKVLMMKSEKKIFEIKLDATN